MSLHAPPAVGDQLTDISVLTSQSTRTSLSALSGDGFLLVFVYRGCWCAFCLRRLVDFRDRINAFGRTRIRIAALSTDEPAAATRMKDRLKLPFELLCDPGAALVTSWHLQNARDRGTARPAAVLIDATQRVRWVSQDDGYSAASVDDVLRQCAAVVRGDSLASDAPRRLRIPGVAWWLRAARNELQFGRGARQRGIGSPVSARR
ncbi:MAG: redoxin domain-containing protein [Gemmatimonadaceae bacterium]